MNHKVISSQEDVNRFLIELKALLTDADFDVRFDLDILPKKKQESPTDPYTTENTLLALDFDRHDVLNQLMSLETSEYIETFIDDLNDQLPPFFAFAQEIKNSNVYIKVKIRDRQKHKIFCVSFHFARYPLLENLPYK